MLLSLSSTLELCISLKPIVPDSESYSINNASALHLQETPEGMKPSHFWREKRCYIQNVQ
ncbi:hypothetical protein PEX1_051650 [Penicillium expansum]|uniref:Uncharacterized protein n=1 Tax=Penicillium expansum TaxID=27334 RepID=A0A0A2JWB9_PENEN|nr:hypothetical protein PEX2_055250 [Penicillium expansum]KGO40460.1 hypothetical protein PEXP_030360 [Penicillium expansum]KGO59684.1 hypothetical protein PEX2_055250 [Penicillium expansum]KGO66360.1 hypothetical protein PEX1_051650 [Penicillium expansum]